MKTKRSLLIIVFISLVFSICTLCIGISSIPAFADTGVTDTQVQPEQSEPTTVVEPTVDPAENAADEANNAIKNWISVIVGGIDTLFSMGLFGMLLTKKKQPVAVTVNDEETQKKLALISAESAQLKDALVAMLTLEKGTMDVLKSLYAENPNLDDKIRNTINEVSLNSEHIIKDVKDIFDKENSEKVKQVFKSVSNIVLG